MKKNQTQKNVQYLQKQGTLTVLHNIATTCNVPLDDICNEEQPDSSLMFSPNEGQTGSFGIK